MSTKKSPVINYWAFFISSVEIFKLKSSKFLGFHFLQNQFYDKKGEI